MAVLLSSPSEIGPAFADALRADSFVAAHERLAVPGSDRTGWESFREVVDQYDCIVVHALSSSFTENADHTAAVELSIDATAVTSGTVHRAVHLPRFWVIQAVSTGSGWRITSADTRERVAARVVVAAPEGTTRDVFENHLADLDFEHFAGEIIDVARQDGEHGEPALRVAIDVAREIEDRKLETSALRGLAFLEWHSAVPTDMVSFAEEALAAARASGDPDAIALGLTIAGTASEVRGEADEAIRRYLAAGAMIEQLEDPRLAIRALHLAGFAELRRARFAPTVLLAQREADLSRRYGWLQGEVYALFLLSNVQGELGNRDITNHLLRRLIPLTRQLKDRTLEGMALSNSAMEQIAGGHPQGAPELIEQAIDLEKDVSPPEEFPTIYSMLAAALMANRRFEEAERAFAKARNVPGLKPDPQREATVLVAMSELRLRQGNPEAALALAREAAAIGATRETAGSDLFGFSPWGSRWAEARALRNLGRCDEAIAAYQDVLAAIEVHRTSVAVPAGAMYSFMAGAAQTSRELAEVFAEKGQSADALAVSNAAKARTLLDAVGRGRVDPFAGMTAEERDEHRRLNEQIARVNVEILRGAGTGDPALQKQLEDARARLEIFELGLFARHPPMRVEYAERPLRDAEPFISEGMAVVDYLIGDVSTLATVLVRSGDGIRILAERLPAGRDQLQKQVGRYLEKLERRDMTQGVDAKALYQLLVAPLEPHLGTAKLICIIPDGPLWRVPFSALQTPSGAYLVQTRAFFYAPSLATMELARARVRNRKPHSIISIGNTSVGTAAAATLRALTRDIDLGDLPDAASEARQVGRMYEESRVLIGSEAREDLIKSAAPEVDVLHFATHALVTDSQPMYSSIVLSAGGSDDGLLEAREVLETSLHADLVVLSGCRTARGEISGGEGLVGLSWSFLIAGASSTVASQWAVTSRSTAELMVNFHRVLTSLHGGGKAEALRQAQLALMKKPGYEHPHYWSPFVLIGAGW